ncbi:MAG: DUF2726 domain-containing protein [Candidatus Paceibacterota bacterium]
MRKSGIQIIIEFIANIFKLIFKKIIKPLFGNEIKQVRKLPYKKKDYLFTYSEKTFFNVLSPIVEKHHLQIFGKVRMEDLLYLPRMERSKRMHFRGKVKSRHIDFVLCDKKNYTPVLAIELNGSSHDSKKQKEIDRFKMKALQDAGLPFLSVKYSKYYNQESLENEILNAIKPKINKEEQE